MALVVFIGIVVWAYSSRRKADFDEAGRMAMDDDKPAKKAGNNATNNNGSNSTEE
jgi:cytochrome c oxidase cbb3-type subunit 4